MAKDFTNDYTVGPITGPLVKFGIPLFLGNLLQIVYNMVDMIIVGNFCGQTGLSGVAVGGEITEFFTVLIMGFSSAAQIIIAQLLGAGARERIGRFIGTFAITLGGAAVINTTIALILRRHLLVWMNTPAEAFSEALGYSVVSMSGIVFVFGYNAVSAVMRGLGDSKRPFIFIATAAVVNLLLDLLFVAVFKMGAQGAALATVMAQAISFISAIIYLGKNRQRLGFEMRKEDFRMDWGMFKTLVKLGIPMALKSAAVSLSKLFTNSFIHSYGLAVTSITAIGNKINQIGNLVSNSLNTAGASMIGQNIGAEKYNRVLKVMLSVWIINISITAILAAVLVIFPEQVFGLFASKDLMTVDPQINKTLLAVALEFVPMAVLGLFASAFRSGANSLVNGSGNASVNMAVALLDAFIFRIGLSLLFGLVLKMEYRGFWLGSYVSGFTPFFIGIAFYLSGKWKTNKHVVKK